MATTPAPIVWKYSDWRRQATATAQRARLVLHLEELAAMAVEFQAKGRILRLDTSYRTELLDELHRLDRRLKQQAGYGRFGVSTFERGSGP